MTEEQAEDWAAAINDVRLALGAMLDIGPDGPQRLSPDHPMAGHVEVYQWLTYLQEYLVLSLLTDPEIFDEGVGRIREAVDQ